MKVRIVFLESTGRKFNIRQIWTIRKAIRNSAEEAVELLNLNRKLIFTFTVYPLNRRVEGKPWVGGTAQAKDWVDLTIPTKPYPDLEVDLRGTIFHEMHHTARNYCFHTMRGSERSLINAVFSEGLATVFETKSRKPPYAEYDPVMIEKWLPLLKEEMWNRDYNHYDWFFGEDEKWWLGYKIGVYLVRQILQSNPDLTPENLASTSAKELLKLTNNQILIGP